MLNNITTENYVATPCSLVKNPTLVLDATFFYCIFFAVGLWLVTSMSVRHNNSHYFTIQKRITLEVDFTSYTHGVPLLSVKAGIFVSFAQCSNYKSRSRFQFPPLLVYLADSNSISFSVSHTRGIATDF